MPSDTLAPPASASTGYRALLRTGQFAALFSSFTLTVAANALAGLALGTLVGRQTGSPFLTAVSMYGATFATVLGALTLMSVADGRRPRRTLLVLHGLSLAGTAAQAVPGLPLVGRFGVLVALGFVQSLGTATRMGLLAEAVPAAGYAPARSLMNIASGGVTVLGCAAGAALLHRLDPQQVLAVAAGLSALSLLVVAAGVRERPIGPVRRPGLRSTWATNALLFADPGRRALLLNLWVPNGLVVGCEALFVSFAPGRAGALLAAASAGMTVGDLVVGRLVGAAVRRRLAFPLRLLLAVPFLLFALRPPTALLVMAVFAAGAGFSATLPLQEQVLALTPERVRGQVQGVESAGRTTCQGIGAALAGGVAQLLGTATAITVLAAASVTVTVLSRPAVARAGGAPGGGGVS
ncbi:hypothetical protein [Kitasatospora sp. DSM 101779]|uniref:hypothetical protein n=1 Tax=Kitasatospora sp. DSM 101779 TaxID=2853165 RepID=UPI0021DAFA18|nr:hypothetical protein [Kitasatospora sp. DSM 101779]MCU7826623.1 hypothetical protein [Kitasatospora sp. DSM 101779]